MGYVPYNHNGKYFSVQNEYIVYTSGVTNVTPYLAFGSLFVSSNGASANIPDPQGALLYPKIAFSAGTAGIYTVTVTSAPPAVAGAYIDTNITLSYKTSNLGYLPPLAFQYRGYNNNGDTTTTIATALTAQIQAVSSSPVTATSSGAAIILTEKAVGQLVTVLASNATVVTSTASVVPFGTTVSMLAMGVQPGDYSTTVSYDAYVFNFNKVVANGQPSQIGGVQAQTLWVFVDNTLSSVESAISAAIAGTDTASLYFSVPTS